MALPETTSIKSVNGISSFFREVKSEMKKVTWPTKQQLIVNTVVVFVAVIFVAALIWGIDSIFSVAFRWLLRG